MRHKVKKAILNKPKAQRKLLIRNLATSLVTYDSIKTTEAKAKALKPIMDKLINTAKKKDKTIATREIKKVITTDLGVKKIMNTLSKKYEDRQSGYTRIIKLGFRAGDAAPLVQIELI